MEVLVEREMELEELKEAARQANNSIQLEGHLLLVRHL
jgi:hypothetical protein